MPRLAAASLLVAAVLALAGCGGGGSDGAAGQGFVAGDGSIVLLDAAQRRAAPEISGRTLTGAELSLGSMRGDVVVLNVWASWCAPCRAEAPDLQEVYEQYDDQGLRMVGLVTRDQQAAAEAFVRTFGLTYPSIIDTDAALQMRFGYDTLPPQAIPTTLVLDAQGRVAARVLGPVSAATLRGLVEPLLAERDQSAS
jgi:thiol-disulfide isomerase/thioredoxin